jgi:hypothetical protein
MKKLEQFQSRRTSQGGAGIYACGNAIEGMGF